MGADLVGKVLGDFQVEALVGKGSMARVYQARQISLRRNVGLKVLEEGIFTPHENIKRFLREAEAMARLEHAHIVPVYAAGEAPPYYFFAMRLIRGGNLATALKAGASRTMIIRWAYQVCTALAYAHQQGIVHRDLKPTNVLIQDGVALLGDFGLARLRDWSTITQQGLLLGTPLYMAPEQTLGQDAGAPADCFALGVIIYEMLLGRHPFADSTTSGLSRIEVRSQLFQRIQKCEFVPPEQIEPNISPALVKILTSALTSDPKARYSDAARMRQDLEIAYKQIPHDEQLVQNEFSTFPGPPVPLKPGESTSTLNATPVQGQARTFGRYSIVKQIGHGGQGVVYHARDPVLDRDVALKVLQRTADEHDKLEEHFQHEARVAAKLTHPHIIPIYEYGIHDRAPYITMQLIEGQSLDRLLAAKLPLPLGFTLHVLLQTAEALAYAHDAGVIHLDVKPGNILIQRIAKHAPRLAESLGGLGFPHVLLTDFTMAAIQQAKAAAPGDAGKTRSQRLKRRGLTAATVAYASPEQLEEENDALGPASDIFSLGVVFHEMLTGKRLFETSTLSVTQMLMLHGNLAAPSARAAGVPPEADQLCMQMLQRNVADRCKSAADVIVAVHSLLAKLGG